MCYKCDFLRKLVIIVVSSNRLRKRVLTNPVALEVQNVYLLKGQEVGNEIFETIISL